jgi:hypothetical protein
MLADADANQCWWNVGLDTSAEVPFRSLPHEPAMEEAEHSGSDGTWIGNALPDGYSSPLDGSAMTPPAQIEMIPNSHPPFAANIKREPSGIGDHQCGSFGPAGLEYPADDQVHLFRHDAWWPIEEVGLDQSRLLSSVSPESHNAAEEAGSGGWTTDFLNIQNANAQACLMSRDPSPVWSNSCGRQQGHAIEPRALPIRPKGQRAGRTRSQSRNARRLNAKDLFLVQSKRAGMSYKEIKSRGNFSEAESTLRGRFRTLTKDKGSRVRKPEWTERDVSREMQADADTPAHISKQH